jgi:hypothetical protein
VLAVTPVPIGMLVFGSAMVVVDVGTMSVALPAGVISDLGVVPRVIIVIVGVVNADMAGATGYECGCCDCRGHENRERPLIYSVHVFLLYGGIKYS